jgi:hypothetical protein
MTDPFLLLVDVPPDIGAPATTRGIAVLGTSAALGAIAATAGYYTYARRHRRHDKPDSPFPFMKRYSRDAGVYGAWRWGLMALGFTALMGGAVAFALGA